MDRSVEGWIHGLMGMVIFSGSLPATRLAVADLSPLFLTSGRAVVAAVLAAAILAMFRPKLPARADWVALIPVAAGVVVGFPLLTALALQHISAARSVVFIGLLPLATALFGVLRGGERPRPMFWLFSGIGAAAVAGFALVNGGAGSLRGDLSMIAAVLLCGLGYAEGAVLSRRLGGWQVISWALLLALPLMAAFALATLPASWTAVGAPAWLGFAYVSVFSMLIGFVFWYRGLALGGTARVGQLQLLQPFISLVLSALLLREIVSWPMLATTGLVVLCVAGAKRSA
ncbi:DMT family transporter [Pseudoroseomonas wenyumeiae]|uniref:DMT family transporter n=1 Tax=Teichococcus wenyumeiae TaxID=2478470 RepID=A0A3A9JMK1_9PROT|nr:DMT family transporter [Pseudoroseomonas wenyumeiae]RKK05993.1 DMT family transporter [Pseudoroseomonas wenyumeiae]RMI19912.1 DMT family transporter [Pseudoroseomonas wenyumeiae]